jgi:chorismate dehydratase
MPHDPSNPFAALLLIGDQAMRESLKASDYFVYDLGELWFRFTGLPFVYALWVVNRESIAGKEEQAYDLARTLHKAKSICRSQLPSYVKGSGAEWYGANELISYWQTISYDLGASEIDGVRSFYRYAAELGIVEEAAALSFLPGDI